MSSAVTNHATSNAGLRQLNHFGADLANSETRVVSADRSLLTHILVRLCGVYRSCPRRLASTVDVAIWRSEMLQ
jgi:hypothetical protein